MAGYVKIWTDIWNDDWFISLSAIERSVFLQMVIFAKQMGDTGTIFVKNATTLCKLFNVSRTSLRRIMTKFGTKNAIVWSQTENDNLQIKITNYKYYQQVKTAKPATQEQKMVTPRTPQAPSYHIRLDHTRLRETETSAAPDGAEVSNAEDQTDGEELGWKMHREFKERKAAEEKERSTE
jgi:hypothetical protein